MVDFRNHHPDPEPPIRFAVSLLAALFLAVAVSVAGTSLLLAVRRGPTRTVAPHESAPLQVPEAPQRLAAAPEFARFAAPATVERSTPVTAIVSIRLRGVPPEVRTADMGIATFDATTGAGFSWTPLGEAAPGNGDVVVRAGVHGSCEQWIALATRRSFARHGYLARTRFTPVRDHQDGEVVFEAVVGTTRFQLPAGARRAGPLRLVRVDDPQWLPMDNGTTGLILADAEAVTLLLGAGTYELQDPILPEAKQRFTVPAADAVAINPALTVAEAGHP